jgi:hypothetical protein
MINPLIKIIELFVDEEQDAILQSISVVDKPAIEREFMYFSEDGRKLMYFKEDGDQRIVISPAMIPDKMIPRQEKDGTIYYVYFSKETIAKAAEYLMKYNKQSHSNINHQRIYSDDMYVMESWIKESDNDKSTDYGFGDLPVGTWFVKFRIMNDEAWAKIKSGELKGLSVEGDFLLGTEKYMSNKFSAVRKKYKSAYIGLTKDEADQLDEILHYVEMNIDVAGLPGYVDQGEKEEDMDAALYFAETYTDYPDAAVNNAKRALAWAEENGWGDCGMGPGKARANQLANREPISEDTIARMSAFQRHRQNSDTPYGEGCGKLMWDAWGGEAGVSWAEKKLKEIRKERVENTNIISEAPGAGVIFAAADDIKVGDAVSWQTSGGNPRGKVREIVREGSKKVPGADFEITGTPDNPGFLIELYEEDAEGKWKPTGTMVGRKADSILKNVDFEIEEDPTMAQDFVRYYSPVQKQTIRDFLQDVTRVYGI